MLWLKIGVALLCLHMAENANILLYPYSHCVNSHLLNMERMAAVLLSGGHNVSLLVAETYNGPYSMDRLDGLNILQFKAPSNATVMCDFESLEDYLNAPMQTLIKRFYESTINFCDALLQDKNALRRLVHGKFDLAIYDTVDPCSKVLAGYLDILFIAFHTTGLDTVMPRNPAYLPAIITTFSDDMHLLQRTMNTLAYLVQKTIAYFTTRFYEDLRTTHKLATTLPLTDIFEKASLQFVLGDFGLDYVGPLRPTTILLGGIIQGQTHKISMELQHFLDNSTDQGVILFSFGSLMRTYDPRWRKLFIDALERLPYKVLWKYQGEKPDHIPSNVHLIDWMPQAKILGHPAIRAFITHCGWNSAYESAYNGVPVIAIPLFGDQFFQAIKITKRAKLGIQLDIRELTSELLYKTIIEVTSNSIYKQNSMYISNVMMHRPKAQQDEILYWVDRVTSLNGTNYLKSKETTMSWYQLLLLDVLCIFLLTAVFLLWCISCTCRLIQRTFIRHVRIPHKKMKMSWTDTNIYQVIKAYSAPISHSRIWTRLNTI